MFRKRVYAPRRGGRHYKASAKTPWGVKKYKADIRRAATALGTELKFKDDLRDNEQISVLWNNLSPPTQGCLNGVGQGSGEQQREGRAITQISIWIRGHIEFQNSDTTNTLNWARLILLWDKQTNQLQTDATIVMQNVDDRAIFGSKQMKNQQRFQILKELVVKEPPRGMGNTTSYNVMVPFSIYVNLREKKTNYEGQTGDVTSILDNNLVLIGTTATNDQECVIAYNSRLRYRG